MPNLEDIAKQVSNATHPPVHLWSPKNCGDIDIVIDGQGVWWHEGGRIQRPELVTLFASILWFESGQYYLVTPVEKLRIHVEDVPFIIESAQLSDEEAKAPFWTVTSNVGDRVTIGGKENEAPVELRQFSDQWLPYVRIRYDLWARVNRNVYLQWVEAALMQVEDGLNEPQVLTLCSGEYVFEVARS